MTADLVFVDPPTRAGKWVDRLSPLMEHPGRWALVRRYEMEDAAYGAAYMLRRGANGYTGRKKCTPPPGRWEFKAGRIGFGAWGLWAKYDGVDE